MTKLERAKAIRDHIFSLPESIWKPLGMDDIDASLTVQPGWSAVQTAKLPDSFPEEEAGSVADRHERANDFPFSFILDVWITGKGKVLSLDCGREERLISMRPGPWEEEVFGIEDDPR